MIFNALFNRLKQVATLFLTTITKSKSKIPYGMLYMAKVLYQALVKKFPSLAQKEILKVVGNLIYYRYINGAIVAPGRKRRSQFYFIRFVDSCHF